MNPYAEGSSRFDLWPLRDVTPSDRPYRYAAYSAQQVRRGAVFHALKRLAELRTTLAYWKQRDPGSETVAHIRAQFYTALARSRENEGPRLPGFNIEMQEAA